MRVAVIITAAGSGQRFGTSTPKQFFEINHRSILEYAVLSAHQCPEIDEITLVLPDEVMPDWAKFYPKIRHAIKGGTTRQESVRLGLQKLAQDPADIVLIHDGARPFVPQILWQELINACQNHDAIVPIYAISDALRQNGASLPKTDIIHRVQTPQAFKFSAIIQAHLNNIHQEFADDASLYQHEFHQPVAEIQGDWANIKITYAHDAEFAKNWLDKNNIYISANGFDVHQFSQTQNADNFIMLGGVKIPHATNCIGHSDADCLLHALTDAILGLVSAGDIGVHFPPSDAQWRGAESTIFLNEACKILRINGGELLHVDCTIIGETPKITPYRAQIQQRMAEICQLNCNRVSIKATTTEKLGFLGRKEGIAVQATASARIFIN